MGLAVNEIAPMARDAAGADDEHLALVFILLDDAVALGRENEFTSEGIFNGDNILYQPP